MPPPDPSQAHESERVPLGRAEEVQEARGDQPPEPPTPDALTTLTDTRWTALFDAVGLGPSRAAPRGVKYPATGKGRPRALASHSPGAGPGK